MISQLKIKQPTNNTIIQVYFEFHITSTVDIDQIRMTITLFDGCLMLTCEKCTRTYYVPTIYEKSESEMKEDIYQ